MPIDSEFAVESNLFTRLIYGLLLDSFDTFILPDVRARTGNLKKLYFSRPRDSDSNWGAPAWSYRRTGVLSAMEIISWKVYFV